MCAWRDDLNGVPTWDERPKCRCGFHCWLQVCDDVLKPTKLGCRFFRCPDIDDDFKVFLSHIFYLFQVLPSFYTYFLHLQACTFVEWIDTMPPRGVSVLRDIETKGQYYSRMEQARELERLARLARERRVRQEQIRLKGKEDELQRRRETLGVREAALKQQEEKFVTREARLRHAEDLAKTYTKEAGESSSGRTKKPKNFRSTQ